MNTLTAIPADLWTRPELPFSLHLDGVPARDLLPTWERTESDGRITLTDPASGLEITLVRRDFPVMGAVEWRLEFFNGGSQDSPVLSEILPLDLSLGEPFTDKLNLHYAKGSVCAMDDFLPQTALCHPWNPFLSFQPIGGRSSDGTLPFFNMQGEGGGLVLAIGWTGEWKLDVAWTDGHPTLKCGMARTHLKLHPGERIRTPSVLLLPWTGESAIEGNNALRRILLDEYCPRPDGELWVPPVAHMTMSTYHYTQKVSEEGELNALHRAADLGCEAFWVDACWYGEGGPWWEEVGNWQIRRDVFPNGLKPIADAAHARGMKFVLWFEPERVHRKSPFLERHPEWMVGSDLPGADPNSVLFNLALPEARAYMTDLISGVIQETGVDIYRQDFNMQASPYWQAMDEPDRVGMAEIRHIEALYTMWDDLKARHPGLCIDNCSSGGRRLDLETTSRAVPLWRSDFSDAGGPAYGLGLPVGDQSQTAGLSRWLPLHTAAVWKFSPYEARSAMSSGVVLYCDIRVEDFPAEAAKRAIAELKRLRPFFLGDFYPLSGLTIAYHDWCTYQFHRSDLNAGFAVFLRRHESPFSALTASLRGLDPDAGYEVTMRTTFDDAPAQTLSGAQLQSLPIEIQEMPGSVLVEYRKMN